MGTSLRRRIIQYWADISRRVSHLQRYSELVLWRDDIVGLCLTLKSWKDTSLTSERKMARVRYTATTIRVKSTYDPGFVAALKSDW